MPQVHPSDGLSCRTSVSGRPNRPSAAQRASYRRRAGQTPRPAPAGSSTGVPGGLVASPQNRQPVTGSIETSLTDAGPPRARRAPARAPGARAGGTGSPSGDGSATGSTSGTGTVVGTISISRWGSPMFIERLLRRWAPSGLLLQRHQSGRERRCLRRRFRTTCACATSGRSRRFRSRRRALPGASPRSRGPRTGRARRRLAQPAGGVEERAAGVVEAPCVGEVSRLVLRTAPRAAPDLLGHLGIGHRRRPPRRRDRFTTHRHG